MKRILLLLFVTVSLINLNSCSKKSDLNSSLLNPDINSSNSDLDTWLNKTFLTPYNIRCVYKWSAYNYPQEKVLNPPAIGQVKKVMEMVNRVLIKPYTELGGDAFMKKIALREIVLVGTKNYSDTTDGQVILGTGEQGHKITIYNVNEFKEEDTTLTREMTHLLFHEFTHIMTQSTAYDPGFKKVAGGDYNAAWFNEDNPMKGLGVLAPALNTLFLDQLRDSASDVASFTLLLRTLAKASDSTDNALHLLAPILSALAAFNEGQFWGLMANLPIAARKGFISAYASSDPDEDFAETLSNIVGMNGQYQQMLTRLRGLKENHAYDLLKTKEKWVYDYLKASYNIDLYALQQKVEAAILNK